MILIKSRYCIFNKSSISKCVTENSSCKACLFFKERISKFINVNL